MYQLVLSAMFDLKQKTTQNGSLKLAITFHDFANRLCKSKGFNRF